MRVRASVLMIVAAMIAGPARAEFIITGSDLYTRCNSNAPEEFIRCPSFFPVDGHAGDFPAGVSGASHSLGIL